MSTEKYPAELVEKVAKAIYTNERESILGGRDWPSWENCRPGSKQSVLDAAVAALDALDLSVTERWQAEWRGRMGVSACATDSRENAIVLAGEGGTVRRRTELYAETPWEVVTDEHVSNR